MSICALGDFVMVHVLPARAALEDWRKLGFEWRTRHGTGGRRPSLVRFVDGSGAELESTRASSGEQRCRTTATAGNALLYDFLTRFRRLLRGRRPTTYGPGPSQVIRGRACVKGASLCSRGPTSVAAVTSSGAVTRPLEGHGRTIGASRMNSDGVHCPNG
jgi:hypothetical protein